MSLADGCQLCPLAADRRGERPLPSGGCIPQEEPVWLEGTGSNGILVLAQGPGDEEMQQGRPMVGKTGEKMRTWLELAGLVPTECWLWNVTMCMPRTPKSNRPLTAAEIKACTTHWVLPWLHTVSDRVRLIVAFGGPATKWLTGLSVTTARGKLHRCVVPGLEQLMVLPTWHASYIFGSGARSGDMGQKIAQWQSDMHSLRQLLFGVEVVPHEWHLLQDSDPVPVELWHRDLVGLDTETTGLREREVAVLGVSTSHAKGVGAYHVGLQGWPLGVQAALSADRRVLWNAPFDLAILSEQGYDPAQFEPFEDGLLAARVLGWPSGSLKSCALNRLGVVMDSIEDLGVRPDHLMDAPLEKVAEYAATDAIATRRLWVEHLEPELQGNPRLAACYRRDRDLVVPIIQAQRRGMLMDRDLAAQAQQMCLRAVAQMRRQMGWNLGSNDKVRQTLLEMGARWKKQTDGGELAVDKEVLLDMAPWCRVSGAQEPVGVAPWASLAGQVLQHRRFVKAGGTYLRKWLRESENDGRIRTHFGLTKTRTFRLASSEPLNAQNVPPELRDCFIAPAGHAIVEVDASQIELRCLAEASGDPLLIQMYQEGVDLHEWMRQTADLPHTEDGRRTAKILNFTALFGGGPRRWAEVTGLPLEKCEALERQLFLQVPAAASYKYQVGKELLEQGFVETIAGRRRWFPGIFAWDDESKAEALRQAMSMKIQGLAAELLKLALGVILPTRWRDTWVLTVHDSVLMYIPTGLVAQVCQELYPLLTQVGDLCQPGWRTPIDWEFKSGPDWGHLTKVPKEMYNVR